MEVLVTAIGTNTCLAASSPGRPNPFSVRFVSPIRASLHYSKVVPDSYVQVFCIFSLGSSLIYRQSSSAVSRHQPSAVSRQPSASGLL